MSGRKELTREEISEMFGVEWVTKDYGIVKVKPAIKEPEIIEYSVVETTPYTRVLLNNLKRTAVTGIKFFGLLRRLFYKPCYMEVKPKILFRISPVYVQNVKFHWAGLYFEGDIVTKFHNLSEEAKEGVAWVRRRQPCPEDPSAYEWKTVEGSASLLGNWLHNFWEDTTNTYLGKLMQKLKERLDPGRYVSVKGHWQTGKLSMDTFMTLWNIITTGTIVTRNGFDVTITYNYKGQQVRTYHVNVRVRLPVKGDVQWWNW